MQRALQFTRPFDLQSHAWKPIDTKTGYTRDLGHRALSRRKKNRLRLGRAGRSYLDDAIKMATMAILTVAVISGSVYLAMLLGNF